LVRCPKEHFEITEYCRRYDRKSGKFIVNIAYETATEITPRTIAVSEAFGLGVDQQQKFVIFDNVELKIGAKDIVYITGDSGSGKSVLLKALAKDIRENPELGDVINIVDFKVDQDRPLIETVGKTVEEGLELLSRVGLNDAFLFVRRFKELSDGQRYRYRIAKMIESGAQWWVMDEFCATLDRDTAKIVAFNLQKLARQEGKAVLAATTHTDLFEDLKPSVHIHKHFGKEIEVHYYPNEPAKECSLTKEIRIEEGTRSDYALLAGFHYRSHNVGIVRKIFRAVRSDEVAGAIVYCYPGITVAGRLKVLPKMTVQDLNQKLSVIMRVVVHPKYRTIGLGQRLVRETLPLAGTPYVETIAVMARYNPFFEHAGMMKIAESTPNKQVVAALQNLEEIGFSSVYMGSETYNVHCLQDPATVERVREILKVFSRRCGVYHKRILSLRKAFPTHPEFCQIVDAADIVKLAKMLRILSFLAQPKVYLFWKNPALHFLEFLSEEKAKVNL
jgi:ABC-type lipoprotein export system ATPase subunit/GNAT superfamily N-acetyltransferase